MNKTITSKEAILQESKNIVAQLGLQQLNIRNLAQRCGVSVGSIYNYFPTKSDLVAQTIEIIWVEIMGGLSLAQEQTSFKNFISEFYADIKAGSKDFPNFFSAHSLNVTKADKEKARQGMEQYFFRIKKFLKMF